MSSGHCEHCAMDAFIPEEGDTERQYACDEWKHADNAGAEWIDGHCPACAARARIVTAIKAARPSPGEAYADDATGWIFIGMDKALKIARGEADDE